MIFPWTVDSSSIIICDYWFLSNRPIVCFQFFCTEVTGSVYMIQRSPIQVRTSECRQFDDEEVVAVITCVRSAVMVTPWSRVSGDTCAMSVVWPRGSSALIVALAASNAATWASIYAGSTPVSASISSTRPDEASPSILSNETFLFLWRHTLATSMYSLTILFYYSWFYLFRHIWSIDTLVGEPILHVIVIVVLLTVLNGIKFIEIHFHDILLVFEKVVSFPFILYQTLALIAPRNNLDAFRGLLTDKPNR